MNTIERLSEWLKLEWVRLKRKRPVPQPPQSKVSRAVDPPVAQYHYRPKPHSPKSDAG